MKPTVLIVEDDIFTARTHQLALDKAAFNTRLAQNGRQALHLLEKFHPNFIILDLIMPELDGFDTIDYLRISLRYRHLPIVVISNLEQAEDVQKCYDLGATHFFSKNNLEYPLLIEKIHQILQKS